MGVSISMRAGSIARSKGDLVNITPGCRSEAAKVMREAFGEFPFELHADNITALRAMEAGASVYTRDEENIWKQLADAVDEYDVVTVVAEY